MLEAEADSVLPPVYCHLKKGREGQERGKQFPLKGNLKVAHITPPLRNMKQSNGTSSYKADQKGNASRTNTGSAKT